MDKALIIVAHPDDEVLWGGETLFDFECDVICITNGSNVLRKKKFEKVSIITNTKSIIYDFPDEGNVFWNFNIREKIKEILTEIIITKYKFIVTHSPDGEYGHLAHIDLSNIVCEVFKKHQDKIYFFDFDFTSLRENKKVDKLIKIYYNLNSLSLFFSKKYHNIKIKKIKSVLFLVFKKFIKQQITLENIELSKYSTITKKSEFKSKRNNIISFQNQLYSALNVEEYFLINKELIEKYKEREYLSKKVYPKLVGKTLNVGCHYFNKWDYLLFQNPKNYYTIDIDEKYSPFGSPYNHKTIDFLDLNSDSKFDNIILFGVLGIPNLTGNDNYTLNDNIFTVIKKAIKFLSNNGQLILGPDIHHDAEKSNISFWENLLKSPLLQDFKLKEKKHFKNNLIYWLEKN